MSSPIEPTPLDKSIGWKWWSTTQDRWWQGTQWAETYRTYDEPRPREAVSTIGFSVLNIISTKLTDKGVEITADLKEGVSLESLGLDEASLHVSIYGGQTTTPYSIEKKEEQ